ncbi:AzlD domain-containing protein [Heliobacterium gestii]|uniref:AzlD domain-containing protein n=1 Tax=Heliomicrobium gestii TaxID=2699 RepID=A0A845LAM4_HELGE|nr:AzlD domain-containing protein [Heliomicrobium gestii]MBM7866931.1 branched-subunit amino acid transport protein [Heliomicrobium gestii]MZP42354.1 AzlD domain-containing protein [Heliomicrobium gestii]
MRSDIFLIIAGMAGVTFLTRFGALGLYRFMPPWLEKWLKYVPTAVLTILIAPALLMPAGRIDLSLHNDYLLAGLVAGLVAYKTSNVTATLGLSMAVMFSLRWWHI